MIENTSLDNQVVLVTGAASGIGKQIAIDLCARGAKVVASDQNLQALQELASQYPVSTYQVDFTDEKSIVDLVSTVESEVGPISAVVNCVGILGKNGDKIEFLDIADFDLVYAINLRGAVILTKAVIAGMAQRGYGRILHIASISGKEGNPLLVAYSATKAGLIGMVKSVGKEYATSGVTINAMAPALIESPMSASFSEAQMSALKSKIPMERLGKGQEVADLAAWIISPACSFTTGFTFDLSGGRATY
jgi:NAD(P)-dependent dehydrogenase (short-subunit alcohol dehydrogenase family)